MPYPSTPTPDPSPQGGGEKKHRRTMIGARKMASIRKEILTKAKPDDVWDALRDIGALHTRLVPGFVTDTKLDGDARIVTFANGTVAREILVDCNEERKRLVYAINGNRVKH